MAMMMRLFEACLLVAMGAFMAVLSQSPLYWQFINPKYSWLTFGTGFLLIVVGLVGLFNAKRERKLSEFLGILTFLCIAVTAVTSYDYRDTPEMQQPVMGSLTLEYQDAAAPTVTVDGVEYQKINVAELIQGEAAGFVAMGQQYAVQGAVVRSPELDRAGYIGIGRLLITCCFADSTGVICLVKVGAPAMYRHGSWVRALGTLEAGAPLKGKTIHLTGALTGVRSERFILRADAVEERAVEGIPFIFEISGEPPFAY